MPPTTRSDQGFSSARQGDFQPSFQRGDFQYDIEFDYFEITRLLQDQNKSPPRTLAEVILDLFSDDEEVAKKTVRKWEQLKLDAVRFKGITDTVKNGDGVWVWDTKSNYPMRYSKNAWIPVLVIVPNMTMTGIVSPKHQKPEVDFRWKDEEYANGGYAARVTGAPPQYHHHSTTKNEHASPNQRQGKCKCMYARDIMPSAFLRRTRDHGHLEGYHPRLWGCGGCCLHTALFALMASNLNSTMREGGLSTYTIEWGHIDDYIRMLVKMKVPYEDFYRILAGPEAFVDNGFDQANVTALARLRDYDNHEDRAGFYNLVKLQVIKDAQVKFREKAQQEEEDYQQVLAIQREQDHSFGGQSTPHINPGPVVPMSPPRPRPAPLFVSTSASTSMLPSSFRASQFGASAHGASTIRASIPFPSPTLSSVRTQFTRFGTQARRLATTSRVRSPTVSDREPLESLASLFPIPSFTEVNPPTSPTLSAVRSQFVRFTHQDRVGSPSTTRRAPPSPLPLEPLSSLFSIPASSSPQRITSPTPSVASPELVEIDDEDVPNADDLAFLDDRDTDTIMNEYRGGGSDEEFEARESVSDNSSEDTHNSAELENKVIDPTWTPEGDLDQGSDDEEVEEEIVVVKSARRVEPFPVVKSLGFQTYSAPRAIAPQPRQASRRTSLQQLPSGSVSGLPSPSPSLIRQAHRRTSLQQLPSSSMLPGYFDQSHAAGRKSSLGQLSSGSQSPTKRSMQGDQSENEDEGRERKRNYSDAANRWNFGGFGMR